MSVNEDQHVKDFIAQIDELLLKVEEKNSKFTSIDSSPYLFINKEKKEFFNTDKSLVLALVGPSGSGKSIISKKLNDSKIFSKATTGTTRDRREGESEDNYYWLPKTVVTEGGKKLTFGDIGYEDELVKQYQLLEWNNYNNNIYGALLRGIEDALTNSDGKAVIAIEPNGAAALREKLPSYSINCYVVGILPDKAKYLWDRMFLPGEERNDPMGRLETSLKEVKWILENCDMVVKNFDGQLEQVVQDIVKRFGGE